MSITSADKVMVGTQVEIVFYDSGLNAAMGQTGHFSLSQRDGLVDIELPWKDLPITKKIGIPLMATFQRGHHYFAQFVEQQRMHRNVPSITPKQEPNQMLATLATEIDVGDDLFGQPRNQANGEVVFKRADGEDLTRVVLQMIDAFILELKRRNLFENIRASNEDVASKRLRVDAAICPKQFVMFFKRVRKVQLKVFNMELMSKDLHAACASEEFKGQEKWDLLCKIKRWTDANCPVVLDSPVCDRCGRESTATGGRLFPCPKCG